MPPFSSELQSNLCLFVAVLSACDILEGPLVNVYPVSWLVRPEQTCSKFERTHLLESCDVTSQATSPHRRRHLTWGELNEPDGLCVSEDKQRRFRLTLALLRKQPVRA